MNIFHKYGIKEVADVTFYSIIRINEEEFYVPVLYLDTLKISSLNKTVESSVRYGGYGNAPIVGWNFEKNSTIKLEDALFSQLSMNMFLNGQVITQMSNWTTLIAKLSLANRYGEKGYSIKTKPSPTLSQKEWDIIYRCAQKAYPTSQYIYDDSNNERVAERRWDLMKRYYSRTQQWFERDLYNYIDIDKSANKKNDGVTITFRNRGDSFEQKSKLNAIVESTSNVYTTDFPINIEWKNNDMSYSIGNDIEPLNLYCTFKKEVKNNDVKWRCIEAYFDITLDETRYDYFNMINLYGQVFNISNVTEKIKSYIGEIGRYYIGNENFFNDIYDIFFPLCSDEDLSKLGYKREKNKDYCAMPKRIIEEIRNEITSQQKINKFNNNLSFSDCIDRMERCVVTDSNGLYVDLFEQSKNVQKKYMNEKSSYNILYDAKTMLPFANDTLINDSIYSEKAIYLDNTMLKKYSEKEQLKIAVQRYAEACGLTNDIDYSKYKVMKIETPIGVDPSKDAKLYYIKFEQPKTIYLSPGTIYYKWSRTMSLPDDNTYIGTDIDISADYFSGEYMIVGETLIRDQMTGQDEHYQLVLNRTTVSQCANLQLQAGSNPVTFSMELNVLQPKVDKPMVQLRQFKTVEDKQYGGNKIIPQFKQHVQTFTEEIVEQEIEANNEIY